MWVFTNLPCLAAARLTHTVSQISQCATQQGRVHSAFYVGNGEAKMNKDIIIGHYGNVKVSFFVSLRASGRLFLWVHYSTFVFFFSSLREWNTFSSPKCASHWGINVWASVCNCYNIKVGSLCFFLFCCLFNTISGSTEQTAVPLGMDTGLTGVCVCV